MSNGTLDPLNILVAPKKATGTDASDPLGILKKKANGSVSKDGGTVGASSGNAQSKLFDGNQSGATAGAMAGLQPIVEETPVPEIISTGFEFDNTKKYVPVNQDKFGNPLLITPNGAPLSINPRTIPITPSTKDDKTYITELQERLSNGRITEQDEIVLKKNRNPLSTFNADDDSKLQTLIVANVPEAAAISNFQIPSIIGDLLGISGKTFAEVSATPEGKLAQVNYLKEKLKREQLQEDLQKNAGLEVSDASAGELNTARKEQFDELELLQKKLGTQLAKAGESEIEANVSTDESGNQLQKLTNRIFITSPLTKTVGQGLVASEVIETKQNLPVEFSTGLNYLKYVEPVEFERITRSLKNGEAISESQIATITAQGIEIAESRLQDKYSANEIDKPEYIRQATLLQQGRYKNIVENKETLRALLSEGIANYQDDVNIKLENATNTGLAGKIFGHRWNYTDEEIQTSGEAVAKAYGLDPNDANVQNALKYLKDNEGAMILQNSIAKSGFVRDFAKGLASPIRGISSSIEDIGKTDAEIYAEGQSQGNVKVAEKRLKRIDNSWEGTVASVAEGTGQFVTQAALAYAGSGVVGTVGRALVTENAVAGAAANNAIANVLINTKGGLSTFITSYAQSYDGNLKQAQAYTADENVAHNVAIGMSGLEGMTELILSPLDIARGIGRTLIKPKTSTQKIVDIISDEKILNKKSVIKDFLSGTMRAGLQSSKVIATEIGEEEVVALADYAANAILNPNSQSFQNRDLMNEVVNTANQTGLSMAIPALLSGIGAGSANNFEKGTLLIAAQNRQHLLDDMQKRVTEGKMSEDEYNEKALIINTAETANAQIPQKADNQKLNSQQKADYVFSRVTEAVLNKKMEESKDEAEKTILSEKIKNEQNYRLEILKSTGNENDIQPQQVSESTDAENTVATNQPQTETTQVPESKVAEVVIDTETFNQVKASASDVQVPVLKTAIENGDENTVTEVLKEVSDQWHDEGTRAQTERDFGKVITDAAIKLYPQESQKSLVIDENGTAPQTNETQTTETPTGENIEGITAESNAAATEAVTEPEAQIVQSQPERTINKDNKADFTTKSGKQVVSFANGDLEVKDTKTGQPVSTKTQKKALQEYADNFDYTVGEFAIEPPPTIQSEVELNDHIIENSNNPYEVAEVYINEEPTTQPLSTVERFIADYGIGKVKEASYNEFGDRNNMGMSKAKSYINSKTGRALDEVALEMSDHYGIEITPQDLVDFMDRFPNGEGQALREVESETAVRAASKFKELTGINLNKEIATKAIEQQFNKLSKAEQAIAQQDYETREQLESAYWQEYTATNGFTEESVSSETTQPSEENRSTETVAEPSPTCNIAYLNSFFKI